MTRYYFFCFHVLPTGWFQKSVIVLNIWTIFVCWIPNTGLILFIRFFWFNLKLSFELFVDFCWSVFFFEFPLLGVLQNEVFVELSYIVCNLFRSKDSYNNECSLFGSNTISTNSVVISSYTARAGSFVPSSIGLIDFVVGVSYNCFWNVLLNISWITIFLCSRFKYSIAPI